MTNSTTKLNSGQTKDTEYFKQYYQANKSTWNTKQSVAYCKRVYKIDFNSEEYDHIHQDDYKIVGRYIRDKKLIEEKYPDLL